MNNRALHIVLNTFTHDTRVLKECYSIINSLEFQVVVFAMHKGDLSKEESREGLIIKRFSTRNLFTYNYFSKYLDYYLQMVKKGVDITPEIVHAHDLLALPIGAAISSKLKVPLVYDAHEYETERTGIREKKTLHAVYCLLEKHFIKKANAVINVNHSIALEYQKNYKISKPHVIYNCPSKEDDFKNTDLYREYFNIPPDNIIFVFEGALHKGRGIEAILEAFIKLKEKDVNLVFMGDGALKDMIVNYTKTYKNIHYKSLVSQKNTLDWLSSADVGLALFEPLCLNYEYVLPNKLFEYCKVGIPVIVSNMVEMKAIVDEFKIGYISNSTEIEDIYSIFQKCINEKKTHQIFKNNTVKVMEKFNWEDQEEKLCKIYLDLLRSTN